MPARQVCPHERCRHRWPPIPPVHGSHRSSTLLFVYRREAGARCGPGPGLDGLPPSSGCGGWPAGRDKSSRTSGRCPQHAYGHHGAGLTYRASRGDGGSSRGGGSRHGVAASWAPARIGTGRAFPRQAGLAAVTVLAVRGGAREPSLRAHSLHRAHAPVVGRRGDENPTQRSGRVCGPILLIAPMLRSPSGPHPSEMGEHAQSPQCSDLPVSKPGTGPTGPHNGSPQEHGGAGEH